MHGTPPALFEALKNLHAHLADDLQQSRVLAAGLLADSRSRERVSPIADSQRRHRLMEASTKAGVLREICEELEELLGEFEEREEADNQLDPRGLSTPRAGAGERGPDPF